MPTSAGVMAGSESSQAPTCLDCGHLHQTEQS
jgi:hypothetical protein